MGQGILENYFHLLNYVSNRKGVSVLMYHRINDSLPPSDLIMSTDKFREHMEYLKDYCDVIKTEELCDLFGHSNDLPRRRRPQVVITIDDGYRDNFLNAYPILKEFQLPATIFLITGMIGTNEKMPRYEHIPEPDMLNWEEIKEMSQNNITFGAHTVTHPHLPTLRYAEQKQEIESSIRILYDHFPQELTRSIFCYPYGEYNSDTLRIMKELGIKIAFTVKRGINNHKTHSIELNRYTGDGRDSLVDFMKKLAPDILGGCRWRIQLLSKGKLKGLHETVN